jgi:hypothetical protein
VFALNAEVPDLCMILKPLKSFVWIAALLFNKKSLTEDPNGEPSMMNSVLNVPE